MNKQEQIARTSLRLDLSACAKIAFSMDARVAEGKYTESDAHPYDEPLNKKKRLSFFESSTKQEGIEAPPNSPIAFSKDVK